MKTLKLFIALLVTASCVVKAQERPGIGIGDMLPDVTIMKMVPAERAFKVSDYKDRLLILDLWGTGCASCIEAMPRLDSLQRQFGEKIRILPVTYEPEETARSLWTRSRYTRNLAISTVVEDSVLHSYFPHRTISHEVWVYKGKVIAITSEEYVKAENIKKVLAGQPVELPLKNDFAPEFNQTAQNSNAAVDGQPSGQVKYAMIDQYRDNLPYSAILNSDRSGIVRDTSSRSIRSYFINQSVYQAYMWSILNARGENWMNIVSLIYGGKAGFAPNRIVWEVADRSKYKYEKGNLTWEEWMKKHAIGYKSLNPDTGQTDREVFVQIAKDLDDLLGLNVRFEKRKVQVLVLTRTSATDLLKTKNAGIDPSYHEYSEGTVFKLRDTGISSFINEFNQYNQNPYAIDSTAYTGRVDMDLNISSWTDVSAIKKALASYGLALKEEIREVEMLVFTETGGGYKQVSK